MKKYAQLYQPLIHRISNEENGKYKKEADYTKAVKTRLHQLYGAYIPDPAHKKALGLLDI